MKIYTYQIGPAKGDGAELEFISHAETLGADDLTGAIEKAREITNRRPINTNETRVMLLEELDGDSRIMWFRPVQNVRNT